MSILDTSTKRSAELKSWKGAIALSYTKADV